MTEHEVQVLRSLSRGEGWGIAATAAAAGTVTLFTLGPFLVPLVVAWWVTIAVLAMEWTAALRERTRRPQFSLYSLFIFTTTWAVILPFLKVMPAQESGWLYGWVDEVRHTSNALLLAPIYFLLATWMFASPAGLCYVAIGTIRDRPAPVFAHVYLSATIVFQTIAVAGFPFAPQWSIWAIRVSVPVLFLLGCAFAVETLLRARDAESDISLRHLRRAVVALWIVLQTYAAIVGLLIALSNLP